MAALKYPGVLSTQYSVLSTQCSPRLLAAEWLQVISQSSMASFSAHTGLTGAVHLRLLRAVQVSFSPLPAHTYAHSLLLTRASESSFVLLRKAQTAHLIALVLRPRMLTLN